MAGKKRTQGPMAQQDSLADEGDIVGSLAEVVPILKARAAQVPARFAFFTQVTSNVKQGVAVQLAACTAIVGPNRASKTAVLDAIRLALTGAHPIGSTGSALMRLAPSKAVALHAKVEGPSGIASTVVEGTRATAKSPRHEVTDRLLELPEKLRQHVIPDLSMDSLVGGSDDKRRKAIFLRYGDATPDVLNPPPGLSGEQEALWRDALQRRPPSDQADLIELIGHMVDDLRESKLEAMRAVRESDSQLASAPADVAFVSAPSATPEQLVSQRDDLIRLEALLADKLDLQQRIEAFKAQAASLPSVPPEEPRPEIKEQGDLHALRQRIEQDHGTLIVLKRVLLRAQESETCPVCRAPGRHEEVARTVAAIEKRHQADLVKLDEIMAGGEAQRAQRAWQQRMAERERIVLLRKLTSESKVALVAEKAALEQKLAAVFAGDHDQLTLSNVRGKIMAVDSMLDQHRALAAKAQEREELEVRKRGQERKAHDLKTLEHEAKLVLQKLVSKAAEHAEAAVNRYMPESFRAQLLLEEEGKQVCRWEVIGQDDTSHGKGAASGSEFAALVTAVALAWTEDTPLRVVLLDDEVLGRFDPLALRTFLKMLHEHVQVGDLTQVVVCWTRPEEIAPGWKIVQRA